MHPIHTAIQNAWRQLHPTLIQQPNELQQRLARRHQKLLSQPPRAWYLAIRACDTRIDKWIEHLPLDTHYSSIVTLYSSLVTHPLESPPQIELSSHSITRLTCPIQIHPPGQPLNEVAALLGVTPN